MVVTVLPLYLVYVGGFSPLAFGLIDGIYNGAIAIVRLASGYIGDRWRRHKEVAVTGYGISAVCKLLLLGVGTAVSAIGAVVLLDRAGKGIRTAPRDAMISLSTPKEELGTAFGVHRAMDTTGAMLGPLWPSACSRSPRSRSTRSSSSRSASRCWAWRCSCCSSSRARLRPRPASPRRRRRSSGALGLLRIAPLPRAR